MFLVTISVLKLERCTQFTLRKPNTKDEILGYTRNTHCQFIYIPPKSSYSLQSPIETYFEWASSLIILFIVRNN